MGILQSVHDKGPAGSLTQVNFSAAQAASDLLNKSGVAQFIRLELRIAARGLPSKDKLRFANLCSTSARKEDRGFHDCI